MLIKLSRKYEYEKDNCDRLSSILTMPYSEIAHKPNYKVYKDENYLREEARNIRFLKPENLDETKHLFNIEKRLKEEPLLIVTKYNNNDEPLFSQYEEDEISGKFYEDNRMAINIRLCSEYKHLSPFLINTFIETFGDCEAFRCYSSDVDSFEGKLRHMFSLLMYNLIMDDESLKKKTCFIDYSNDIYPAHMRVSFNGTIYNLDGKITAGETARDYVFKEIVPNFLKEEIDKLLFDY